MALVNGKQLSIISEQKQNSYDSMRAYCTPVNPLFWYKEIKEKESKFIPDMWIRILWLIQVLSNLYKRA